MNEEQEISEGIIVTNDDVEYFVSKLNRCHPDDTIGRARFEKQIELLKDAIIIYHLKTPPRE